MLDLDVSILLFDLYGRGYSDSPGTNHDEALFTTQLALVMDHVGWHSAVIVGKSLGGAIAASFASYFPQRTEKLILVAPAVRQSSALISRFHVPAFVLFAVFN